MKISCLVIPAEAGIYVFSFLLLQGQSVLDTGLDSRFHGNDTIEEGYFLWNSLSFSLSSFPYHIMNMDQFTRFDLTNRSPNSLPIFDHRPISRYPSKGNFVGKRYFFFRNNFLPF